MTSCITSFAAITSHELVLAEERFLRNDTSEPAGRVYEICPNTVVNVGFQEQGLQYTNGSVPLVVVNPNLHVKCGSDGSSDNNCIVRAGDIQVIAPSQVDVPNTHPNSENFLIEGFTFEGASQLTMLILAPGGNIIVRNCIFQHISTGNFVSYFESSAVEQPIAGRSLSLDKFEAAGFDDILSGRRQQRRRQQRLQYHPSGIGATIVDCVYRNNKVDLAMVGTLGNVGLGISRTRFELNEAKSVAGVGSMIWFTEGSGTVRDSCFRDNKYALSTVLVNNADVQLRNNYRDGGIRLNETVGCDDSLELLEETSLSVGLGSMDYSCFFFDAATCVLDVPPAIETPKSLATVRRSHYDQAGCFAVVLMLWFLLH